MSDAKILDTKELGNVIDGVVKENVKLSQETKLLMARLYDKFRHRIGTALNAHDLNDSAFWISLIGDMMAIVNKYKVEGVEKKEMILETIRIIARFEVAESKRDACNTLITVVLSPAIDLAVYFKNQIEPEKIKSCLCPCIFKK
jgi:hypothetical protein